MHHTKLNTLVYDALIITENKKEQIENNNYSQNCTFQDKY